MSFLGNSSQIGPSQMRDDLSTLPYQLDGVSTFSRSQLTKPPPKDHPQSTLPSQILQLCHQLSALYLPPDQEQSKKLSPTQMKLCKLALLAYTSNPEEILTCFRFQGSFKTLEGLIANFQLDLQQFTAILQDIKGAQKLSDAIQQHLQGSHAVIRLALTLSFHAYYVFLKRMSGQSLEAQRLLECFDLASFNKQEGYVKIHIALFNSRITSLSLLDASNSQMIGCFITTGGQVLKIGSP